MRRAGGGGCLKTERNSVKLLPEHLHSETTGVSGLSGDHILTTGRGWLAWWGSWKELVSGEGTRQTP